ncbi:hypothetical protein RM553_05010 [Zunongwangia sp. F363]|uniref:Lipoprotein n=1 Tax=Autumnicola tepida TaxID=3075595 RepID=A0ABU3C763_9FLAO|nr:hypothetical protein [Zunongwangia sp. F363]MDT0642187.1 hypothetical protein [Zunongwangia sp. F363]
MKQNYGLSIFSRLLSLAMIISLFSCEKDELDLNESVTQEDNRNDISNNFRRKVENPYTISNMQMALDSIIDRMETGKLKSASGEKISIPKKEKITSNMLYVQFTPKTWEEEGLLKRDSTLALIDYPLGYEYEEAWFKSRPKLEKDEIPAYYTTVSVDRKLPNVSHKILAEMYVPQEDGDLEKSRLNLYRTSKNGVGDFVDILLNQAFKQTNNEGMDGLGILKGEKEGKSQNKLLGIEIGEKWLPEGTLRIWDENIGSTRTYRKIFVRYEYYDCDLNSNISSTPETNIVSPNIMAPIQQCRRAIYRYEPKDESGSYVPLKGAQVLLRDTYTIGNEITDSNGYFRFDHKRGEKRYIIQWERYEYSIRNGSLFQAETRGPKKHSRWDHDINGGDDEYHGMIHLAAHDYYYGNRFGLTSPPTNFFTGRQIKIAAREIDGGSTGSSYSHIKNDLSLGIAAQIHIKAWTRSSDRIYGTTIHELAHAAHSMVDRGSYDNLVRDAYIIPWQGGAVENNNRRLLETWAKTVEIVFALKRYRDDAGNPAYSYFTQSNGFNLSNYQRVRISEENHYTSGGYDMIDDFNQRVNYGSAYPIDRVENYTIKQLESALIDAKSWLQWRDNIKSKYSNSTEIYLDELFNNWPN